MKMILLLACVFITCVLHAQWSTDPTVNNAICTVAGDQFFPTIVSDGEGGAIITWFDSRVTANIGDIYAQRINSSGEVLWTADGVAICTAAGTQVWPTIVSDGEGGAIITWEDWRNGSLNTDIYAQRINSSGAVQWTANGVAICTASSGGAMQYAPKIVSDSASGAIITWTDARSVGGWHDIYAQRISKSGAVLWTADGVAICTAPDYQKVPTIVSNGAGGAIITWEDVRSGVYTDIYAQQINSSGGVQWTADGVAISTATGDQQFPTIVSDGLEGAIITWNDLGGSDLDIYSQRINSSGSVLWTGDGVAICTAPGDQVWPTIVSEGSSGAIITWYDYRGSISPDIYAQQINASGQLGVVTSVDNLSSAMPQEFHLNQNYPNPFNPSTSIKYAIMSNQFVQLKVYDVLGKEAATLVNEEKSAGTYEVNFNASQLSSGIYFYKLQAGSFISTKKMILIK